MSSLQQWNSTYKTKFFEPWTEWKGDKSYKRHKCVFCGNSIQDNATYLKKHLTSCKAPQCSLEVKAQAEQSLNSGASKNKRSHDDLTHSSQHSASLADALPMPPASGGSSVGAESDVADECPVNALRFLCPRDHSLRSLGKHPFRFLRSPPTPNKKALSGRLVSSCLLPADRFRC